MKLRAPQPISSGPCPLYTPVVSTVRELRDGSLWAAWRDADGRHFAGVVGQEPELLPFVDADPDVHRWPTAGVSSAGEPVVLWRDAARAISWLRVGSAAPVPLPDFFDCCSSEEWLVGHAVVAGGLDAVGVRLDGSAPRLRHLISARNGEPAHADFPGNEFVKRRLVVDTLFWSERTTYRHGSDPAYRSHAGDLYGGYLDGGSLIPLVAGYEQRTPVDLQSPRFRLLPGPVAEYGAFGADAADGLIVVPVVRWSHGGRIVCGSPDAYDPAGSWRLDVLVRDITGWHLHPHSTTTWLGASWRDQRPRAVISVSEIHLLMPGARLRVSTSRDLGVTWGPWVEHDVLGHPIVQVATQREVGGVLVVVQSNDMRLWCARVEG